MIKLLVIWRLFRAAGDIFSIFLIISCSVHSLFYCMEIVQTPRPSSSTFTVYYILLKITQDVKGCDLSGRVSQLTGRITITNTSTSNTEKSKSHNAHHVERWSRLIQQLWGEKQLQASINLNTISCKIFHTTWFYFIYWLLIITISIIEGEGGDEFSGR